MTKQIHANLQGSFADPGGFRETHATTTSFADLSWWKGEAYSHLRKIKSGIGNVFAYPPIWGGKE